MALLTEDEAKTKWCPLARYKSINGEGINRWVNLSDTQLNPDPAKCIASACMAWRWTAPEHPPVLERRKTVPREEIPAGFHGYDMETDEWLKLDKTPTTGFCGAFGEQS